MPKIRSMVYLITILLVLIPFGRADMSSHQTVVSNLGLSPTGEVTHFLFKLDAFIPFVHDQLHDIPPGDQKLVFDSLAQLQKQIDRDTTKQAIPPITGTALFSNTGDWLAWSGTIDELPDDWMEYMAVSDVGVGVAVLYETSGKVSLVHLTRDNHRIAMTQMTLIDRSFRKPEPDVIAKHKKWSIGYGSPFDTLPGVMLLSFNPSESILRDVLHPIESDISTKLTYGIDDLPVWFRPLFDPHFFAGGFLGLHSAAMLFVTGLMCWMLTHFLGPLRLSKLRKFVFVGLATVSIVLTWPLLSKLTLTLTTDTTVAWWPDFPVEHSLAILVLPLSALLLTGAWIRWLLFLFLSIFKSRSNSYSALKKRPIPGWLCQMLAIVLLAPFLIVQTTITIRQNISDRLQNWINEREYLLPLALENDLETLATDQLLRQLKTEHLTPNTALDLWRQSDLHVFEVDFAVQILDQNGYVLEQFSPFFAPDTLHPETLHQALSVDSGHAIIPPRQHHHSRHSPLIGIAPIKTDQNVFGYLIIQIATEPSSIKPPPQRWGHAVTIHVVRNDEASELYRDIPVVLQAEWFDDPSSDPKWTTDETRRFEVLIYRLPYSDPTQPEILIGLLPRIPLESQLAGIARLALLAASIFIPGLTYREIKRLTRTHKEKSQGAFTRQLLGAYLLPVIVLPLIFAVTLQRVIDDSETEFQKAQMTWIFEQTLSQLKAHIVEQAKILRANVEHQFLNELDSIFDEGAEGAWLILDEFGQEALSGTTLLMYDPPLKTISRVFQETHYRGRQVDETIFQSGGPGELAAHVVMAFPEPTAIDSDEMFQGTFVCEIPITDDILRSFDDSSNPLIAIYAEGSISASNRPELFQTGLIPTRFDASLYRSLIFQKQETIVEFDRLRDQFSVSGGFDSESNLAIGVMTLSFFRFPFAPPQSKAHEWLFPAALFLLVSGILFSLYFGRRIARPVQALTEGAQAVSKGNFNFTVPEHGVGEIRLLTRTFNAMMRDLDAQRINLLERHAFIDALLARMSSAILAVDDSGMVLTWNEAFSVLFPISGIEVGHLNINQIFTNIAVSELKEAFDQYLSESTDERQVLRFFRDGGIFHLAVTFARLESPGGLTGILIVMDDITDTVQSSKLQAYSEMARRIAHEVKNPLTPIQLSIEHLRQAWEDGAADFPAILNQCLSMVLEEVRSLEQISTEFSRFARFPKPSFEQADIRGLIREVAGMYPVSSMQVAFQIQLPDQPLLCRFDHDQMKRVLINLVQNALQAMDNTGVITLKGSREGNQIKIEISDTGPGMNDQTLLNLFEPYFSTKKEGAGLGLVITKAVIDAHNGVIQVSSAEGQGASFTLRLAAVDSVVPVDTENGGLHAE